MGETYFSNPSMYWVGIDTPGADEADLAEFNEYYDFTHVGEVVGGNPGFVRSQRYELENPDPRGDFGPQWLAVYEIEAEKFADDYLERAAGPREGRPSFTPSPQAWKDHAETRWQLIWQQVSQSSDPIGMPDSIFIVGINPPEDATDAEIEEFNDFYTNVHVGEVLASGRYRRGTRYELKRQIRHPDPGSPRYLALYEAFDADADKPGVGGGPSGRVMTTGPAVWQRHSTPWRLTYRRRQV